MSLESRATRREYVGTLHRPNRILDTYRSYESETKRKNRYCGWVAGDIVWTQYEQAAGEEERGAQSCCDHVRTSCSQKNNTLACPRVPRRGHKTPRLVTPKTPGTRDSAQRVRHVGPAVHAHVLQALDHRERPASGVPRTLARSLAVCERERRAEMTESSLFFPTKANGLVPGLFPRRTHGGERARAHTHTSDSRAHSKERKKALFGLSLACLAPKKNEPFSKFHPDTKNPTRKRKALSEHTHETRFIRGALVESRVQGVMALRQRSKKRTFA